MKNFVELDPLLHSQLRLAIMSLLVGVKEADFSYIQEATQSTNGNLSVQIRPTVSYVVNQRLTLQAYFQRELNNPRASNAYKRINTAFGIQVGFSIAQ